LTEGAAKIAAVQERVTMQSFNWVDIDGIRYSWDGQGSNYLYRPVWLSCHDGG